MAKTKKSFIERIKPTGAKDLIRKIILLVCICVFCYSAYNLASIFLEYKSMDDSNKEVEETYVTEYTEQKNSYKTIDFEALLARNSDVKGWIDIPDTKVSYPIVQGETNDTYIHSDIDKKEFRAGSIFIASENKNPFTDLNTVIYGHNMKNGSMFGKLKQMYESEKYKDSKYLWICTPNGKYRYEIFSMQYAKVGSDVYTLFSAHDEQFEAYVKKMAKQSKVDMKALGLGKDDYVVTLSTCTSDESVRFVVQARWVGTYK